MNQPARAAVITAFAAVYLIWGSTYLAIRFAIGSIPPFLMAGARFLPAGLLLYAWMRARGAARPDAAAWWRASIIGVGLVFFGNGGVTLGELFVPSAMAALLIALVPIFIALLGWMTGITARPSGLIWFGLASGLGGVALLLRPGANATPSPHFLLGVGIILASALIWSAASLYAKHATTQTSPFLAAGMQMICGGSLQLVTGLALGEGRGFDVHAITGQSIAAFFYLLVVGSIVGFSAYVWLLQNCPPAQVATYAYVNPVVAVLLGATLGGETLTPGMLAGAALIVVAVAVVITDQTRRRPPLLATTSVAVAARVEP